MKAGEEMRRQLEFDKLRESERVTREEAQILRAQVKKFEEREAARIAQAKLTEKEEEIQIRKDKEKTEEDIAKSEANKRSILQGIGDAE